jgi:hypothetical protein
MAALRSDLPRNRWTRVLAGPFASSQNTRKDASCAA